MRGVALNGFSAPPPFPALAPEGWVELFLLAGPGDEACLRFEAPVARSALRRLVADERGRLAAAGLAPGGTVALRLPPSLGFVVSLLAAWQQESQVMLLDHRLTDHETGLALDRLQPQVLVQSAHRPSATLRGFAEVTPVALARPEGLPARTPHSLIQLSSGSTGPSKVIGRTATDLLRELDCYARLKDFPGEGERVVLLSSVVHVLGLVGGLLNSLYSRAPLSVPERMTAAGILAAVAADDRPTTLIGVPFHAELLTGVQAPPPLPQLRRMIVAGELVRPTLPAAFAARYGVPLGTMYGMTETGVIATDLSGSRHPRVEPVNGMHLRLQKGELDIRAESSPYPGSADSGRWSDGWLHTRDAAVLDPDTGLLTVLGRRDSQVSVGGLKVDLTEVEQTIAALPEVHEAVVVFASGVIEAYLGAEPGTEPTGIHEQLARQLAAYKRPRRLALLPALPRTATGKLLRDPSGLRAAADAAAAPAAG